MTDAEKSILDQVRYHLGTPLGVNVTEQAKQAGHALRQLAEVEKLLAGLVFACEFDMKGYAAFQNAQDYLCRRQPPELTHEP